MSTPFAPRFPKNELKYEGVAWVGEVLKVQARGGGGW